MSSPIDLLLQALKPYSYFGWLAGCALVYWILPRTVRPRSVLPLSLAILLLGEGRPWLLVALAALTAALVYGSTRLLVLAGRPTTPVVVAIVGLYAGLHCIFGLITFTDVLSDLELTPDYVLVTLGLPVAFSFFRLISFVVDAPRLSPGEIPGLGDYLTWMLFFPTFVHVPFIKHIPFLTQVRSVGVWPSRADLLQAGRRIGQALAKGALAGMMYAVMWPPAVLLDPFVYPAWQVALAIPWMALSFYLGFSGYADLSIGVGHLFGLTLPESFAPLGRLLRTTRARDFWRNWNLTTAAWLVEYVYTPLGGYRQHAARNTMLTMVICGLWHSVSAAGILWGSALGGMMLFEHWLARSRIRGTSHVTWLAHPALRTVGAVGMFLAFSVINLAITPFAYTAQNLGGLARALVRLVIP